MAAEPEGALAVALLATEFPSPAETFISARAKTLVDMGVAVAVHSLRFEPARAEELVAQRGLECVRRTHTTARGMLVGALAALTRPALLGRFLAWVIAANRSRPSHLLKCLVLTPRAFEVLADLERERPDVVHAEWGHYPALILWLVQQRLPRIVTSIGLVHHDLETELGCTVAATRSADVIRTVNYETVDYVAAFTGVARERVEVIFDGVDVSAVDAAVAGAPKVPGRVVTVARLVRYKGVHDVIAAFARCAAEHPEATLRVLGEGPEREALEHQAAALGLNARVDFLGHVSHAEVLEELARARVVAHLSESDRLPNVIKEGMAARCVCVTSPTNGIHELIEDGVTGRVVGHGDVAAAAAAISWALSDAQAASEMGSAARESVGRDFDHHRNVSRFLELWRAARARRAGDGRAVASAAGNDTAGGRHDFGTAGQAGLTRSTEAEVREKAAPVATSSR